MRAGRQLYRLEYLCSMFETRSRWAAARRSDPTTILAMVQQRLSTLRACDVVAPSGSPALATGRGAGDGPVTESLPRRGPSPSKHGSAFLSFVGQVAELAKILTGASGSAIAFRGEEGTTCLARSGEGAPPLGAPVDVGSGISKQCLDSGIPLYSEDIATDGRVDPEISQAGGIRAIAVVPIFVDGDISGILEVFSRVPSTFTELHLNRLQQLANSVGSAASIPSEDPTCDSNAEVGFDVRPDIPLDVTFLIAREPRYRVFFRNLADAVSLRSPALLADSSRQMDGWSDVFVDTHVPWKRFMQSVFLHIMMVGMLAGLSRIWPRELSFSPPLLRDAHITYYPLSKSFPARESRPSAHPRPHDTSAHQEVLRSGHDREPGVASVTPSKIDREKIDALITPLPAMPMSAISRFRQLHLPNPSVIGPPPELSGGSGLRTMNVPRATVVPPSPDIRGSVMRATLIDRRQLGGGTAGTANTSIVPPPPSLNDQVVYKAKVVVRGISGQVVGPPPPIETEGRLGAAARAISASSGVLQVVPPPPSLAGAGNSVGGGRRNFLVAGGSQVVPPAPSMENSAMENGGNVGGGRGIGGLDHGASQVVPPPPSIPGLAGGDSGVGGRVGSPVGAGPEGALPPASVDGRGNPNPGDGRVAKDAPPSLAPAVPETGNERLRPIYRDVQLRVISFVWAPPRSSYFSNFEVFLAEKLLSKGESQIIKLVYVFLPYQRRLSEYGFDASKIRMLRVTRDATCDEGFMDMVWSGGENSRTGSQHSAGAPASPSTNRPDALPCYRTTADDYRHAVSRSR